MLSVLAAAAQSYSAGGEWGGFAAEEAPCGFFRLPPKGQLEDEGEMERTSDLLGDLLRNGGPTSGRGK